MRKRKINYQGDISRIKSYDLCQTPFYAIDPLLEFLPLNCIIWESACGQGQIVSKLKLSGFEVIGSDLSNGFNFFSWSPACWDIQVTNPPFSSKYKWLKRSYELDKPFALLLPIDTLGAGSAQRLFDKFGIEVVFLDKRINFKMPHKGYYGTAHFATAWFCWQLNLGSSMTFRSIIQYPDSQFLLISYREMSGNGAGE